MGLHSKGRLLALPENRVEVTMTNTLAYCNKV
jgi:hypothetical protein